MQIQLPFQLDRQKIILIVGIVLALIAVFMIKVYLDQQKQAADLLARQRYERMQANQTPVLFAKKDIARGVTIEPDMLETKVVPNAYVQPGAVTSLDRIAGMTTLAQIAKGEQIILSKLTFQRAGDLASATPAGKRAITISVDNIASLAGMIKAGDYVDVIAVLQIPISTADGKTALQVAAVPLFQNILVLAVGQEIGQSQEDSRYGKQEAKKEIAAPITLALTTQEASLVSFVQEQGKIRLVLRSPADAKVEVVQPASWETLLQYIMPPKPAGPQEELPPLKGKVEIYRGLNKEVVPLYK